MKKREKGKKNRSLIPRSAGSMSSLPIRRFYDLFDHMHTMMDEMWKGWDMDIGVFDAIQPKTTFPKVNVSETTEDYVVDIAAAGFSKDDLALELKDNVLLIKGDKRDEIKECCDDVDCCCTTFLRREISDRSFRRVVKFPREIDVDKIDCSYKDGIVKCKIGKKEIEEDEGTVKIDIN